MTTDKTPATLAVDVLETAAIELWHRFASEGADEWVEETHKAEYRLAAKAVIEILTANQESAPPERPIGHQLGDGWLRDAAAKISSLHARQPQEDGKELSDD